MVIIKIFGMIYILLTVYFIDFRAVLIWPGDFRIFLDALFKLLVFVNCESKNQILKPSSFRRLVIDTLHFFALPKGNFKIISNVK